MVQETKFYKKGTFKYHDYNVFETIRGNKEGGGLLTMVHANFHPVQIPIVSQSKMSENLLTVEAKVGSGKVRFINAYGVQESSPIADKIEFLSLLDQEVENASASNSMICIQMDGNAKFGQDIIQGDPHDMSGNGYLLLELIQRKNLILVNSTNKSLGVLTRIRNTKTKSEKSVLGFSLFVNTFSI